MARYMIHACPARMPYVVDYLLPSLLNQDIEEKDIYIFNDTKKLGNLKAFIASLEWILENWNDVEGVWHIQDDVIISHDFRYITELCDKGMVYGFRSEFDDTDDLWYSFPCIRISNDVVVRFLHWLKTDAKKVSITSAMISNNKYDDALLMFWIRHYYKDYVVRLSPNIVDHVDWLIGGSVVNKQRAKKIVRSVDWKDEYLVEELKEKLYAST